MSLKVLVVPDKFKGTLTAQSAAELIIHGWKRIRATDELTSLPMSDGGDGFGDVLSRVLQVETRSTPTLDAGHRQIESLWWWEPGTHTAIIESAKVVGLALLPPGQYHPFELDTFGLAALLRAAADLHAERCIVGIGGSATNDGGFGLARGLGWTFLNDQGRSIESWTQLETLQQIMAPTKSPVCRAIRVAVDVQNPLLGPTGASRIYGPQKGLRPHDFDLAERCLQKLAEVVEKNFGHTVANKPGAGAAGGLGFGLRCFAGARLESGFNLFAHHARLEERIAAADLVITGEGAIDDSTLMGKGVGEVAKLCRKLKVPCLGLAGTLLNSAASELGNGDFTKVYGIVPALATSDQAQKESALWLPRLAEIAAKEWTVGV